MSLKSFDFFRKLNTDNDTTSIVGGLLTAFAFIITSVLVYNETKLYLKTEIAYSAVIDNDTSQFINIHLDISVQAPCLALSLDQQDEVGVHRLDVADTLHKKRLDKAGRSLKSEFGDGEENYRGSEKEIDDLIQAIHDQETCRFQGYITVNKVPGNFHISYHAQHILMQRLYSRDLALYKKMRLDHTVHSIRFGDVTNIALLAQKLPKTFSQYFKEQNPISKAALETQKLDYEYQLKALPARFEIGGRLPITTLYKYSLTHTEAPKSASEMDSIYFKYQMNPVNMVYSFKQHSFYHFLVQLCAIIGGVFAVLGMLNSVVQRMI